ncbi:MAG: NAD(P)-dependent oxidoreductase [Verrucomicrobia bacterium]|jgi:dTDP-4-dehydrorhamnose reductase|nr:NAD(P)-dependent oxidoreductase [Verrucomicrobiota bacterium]
MKPDSTARDRKTLLVTGASGFLGWHICCTARSSWNVVGTCCTQDVAIDGVEMRALDLRNETEIAAFLAAVRPDAVIHAAAVSAPNDCEKNPALSEKVNVEATTCIARWSGAAGVPLVFTSTDLVFDGEHAPYGEDDNAVPVSVYGRHKLAAEDAVLRFAQKGVACRLPLMFGDRDGMPASFIGPWIQALQQDEPVSLFEDEIRTPVSGAVAARGLLLALEKGVQGVLHLGGCERVSRYAFGLLLAEAFGLSPVSIRKIRLADITMAAPRARDVSLDSSAAFSLGYDPGSLEVQLAAVRESMQGRCNREASAR